MSDDKTDTSDETAATASEAADSGAGGEGTTQRREPPYRIHAQYIKDLSVENPKAPECFMDPQVRQVRPQIEVDITTRALGNRLVEVAVQATVRGRIEPDTPQERLAYLIELSYGAAVEIGNVPSETVEPLMFVEVPRLLFPYIRHTLGVATQDMGHNLLQIPPIDFVGIYRWKKREGTIDTAAADQVAGESASGDQAPSTV